ncbi:hypothetical protein HN51_007184 [Arachis hypogaea]
MDVAFNPSSPIVSSIDEAGGDSRAAMQPDLRAGLSAGIRVKVLVVLMNSVVCSLPLQTNESVGRITEGIGGQLLIVHTGGDAGGVDVLRS